MDFQSQACDMIESLLLYQQYANKILTHLLLNSEVTFDGIQGAYNEASLVLA